MPNNMPETTRFGYNNEEYTRSYSEKISDLRRNDENISDNVKLRDQYFKIIEDTGYSKNRNEEYLNTQVPFSALENRKLEEDMSQEDRAILRQERRDDPTIDDISENEELANYQYHENIKNGFENILSSIDKDSEEYQDIEKVENLITKLTNSDSIELYEYDDFDITLDNPNLDENVYLQFKKENNDYVIDYQDFVEKNDERIEVDISKNRELERAIDSHINASILNKYLEHGDDKTLNEVKNYNIERESKILEVNKDVNMNENEKLDKLKTIEDNLYEDLSMPAKNLMQEAENVNMYKSETRHDLENFPTIKNDLKVFDNKLDELINRSNNGIKNIDFDKNEKGTFYRLYTWDKSGKLNTNSTEFNKIIDYKDRQNNLKSNETNNIENSENLQKLKSVELEKNMIGLLPKDQQENNYKDTLSRLDKNKSTLKEDLKSYMNNTRIENAINSVKQNFENIKVKAEDIHQNFKDLGSWNTENKYVKNINDVVDKVKNLSQKNENKIDLNDPELLKKLETKFKESNDYINKIENINLQDQKLKDNHLNYLSNSLEISNPTLAKETNTITESLSDLSKEDKLNLYNHSKDIESITHDSNFHKPEDIKTIVETHKLTNAIEKDLGKSTVDESRKDYLVSNVKKPAINENFSDNPKLKSYMNNSNDFIQNTSKNDLKKYQERGNVEINKINDNKKANTLKNNDLLQRYNKQEVKQNTNNTSLAEENINEKQQQTKKQGIQIR